MMITRTRLDRCSTRGCPWPDDEEIHVPWCRGVEGHECFGGATHQHHPKRSQGGKEIVALLCAGAHDIIDNGSRFSNDVIERDGRRIYRIFHEKRGILYERDIGASTGEGEGSAAPLEVRGVEVSLPSPAGASGVPSDGGEMQGKSQATVASTSASPPSPGASGVPSDGDGSGEGDTGATIRLGQLVTDAGSPPSPGASRGLPEERVGRASEAGAQPAALSGETPSENLAVTPPDSLDSSDGGEHQAIRNRNKVGKGLSPPSPYTFGDNGIEWEPEFTFDDWARAAQRVMKESVGRQWRVGDLVNAERWAECSQFFDDLGYPPETQANYGRISTAYKLAERRPLSFGHHQAVYKHPERLAFLDAAVENGWTRAELKAEAYPDTRRRLRRFTIEELRGLFQDWLKAEQRNRYNVGDFLDWLEQQDA